MVEEIDEEGGPAEEGTVKESTVSEDGRFDGAFQFNGCQYVAVYIKSGNASGNKVEDSGNIVPQVIRSMSCFPFFLAISVLIRSLLSGPYYQIIVGRLLSPVTIGCPPI